MKKAGERRIWDGREPLDHIAVRAGFEKARSASTSSGTPIRQLGSRPVTARLPAHRPDEPSPPTVMHQRIHLQGRRQKRRN